MIQINRYLSFLLLVCLLPVLTPREVVHDLFGHEDTHDVYHSLVTIEKLHKHCNIFQVTFSTFIYSLKKVSINKEINYFEYSFSQQNFTPGKSVSLPFLRAPPLI